jgi:KDO2-lipid IV(A) lauroyltransferase
MVVNTFYNFSRYLIDFLKIRNNDGQFFQRHLKGENINLIDKALNCSPGGAIILTIHLGNWELGGGYLHFLGYNLFAVALEHSVKYVERIFNRQRKNLGINELPFKDSFKICRELLRSKNLVALLCDRDFTLNYYSTTLFGKTAYIPKAPFLLALRTKVPMVFGVTVREGNDYKVIMEKILEFKHYRHQEIPILVAEVAKIIEKYVLAYPEQWFFFYRFWERPKEVVII